VVTSREMLRHGISSSKVHLPGREPVGSKLLNKNVFLRMRLHLFWTPRHPIGLMTTFYMYLHPIPTGTHEPANHEDHAVGHSPDSLSQLDDFPHDDLEISISRSSELRHLPWGSMVSEVVTPLCRA
jgi:hypothetical protein